MMVVKDEFKWPLLSQKDFRRLDRAAVAMLNMRGYLKSEGFIETKGKNIPSCIGDGKGSLVFDLYSTTDEMFKLSKDRNSIYNSIIKGRCELVYKSGGRKIRKRKNSIVEFFDKSSYSVKIGVEDITHKLEPFHKRIFNEDKSSKFFINYFELQDFTYEPTPESKKQFEEYRNGLVTAIYSRNGLIDYPEEENSSSKKIENPWDYEFPEIKDSRSSR